jgi:23S rRNA (adenine1618-N6)-methyltransferase
MRVKVKKPSSSPVKAGAATFHVRNRHQGRYDFQRLLLADAALTPFVSVNAHGELSIDFADPDAVKELNRALLQDSYGIKGWDIPPQHLCPPVPGRADYVHHLADLLAGSNHGVIPKTALVLDIGTGANCIYPLVGYSEYGWDFVASDIYADSLANAEAILQANPGHAQHVRLRIQPDASAIFTGIVGDDEWFDLTMCNPPFHASAAEARAGSQRKWQNLGKSNKHEEPALNFGGKDAELWCVGGEQAFIQRMITESAQISTHCYWFSTLVSKSSTLPSIYAKLKEVGVQAHKTISMSQGQKQSRLVAWTFLNPTQQAAWRKLRWMGNQLK